MKTVVHETIEYSNFNYILIFGKQIESRYEGYDIDSSK